MCYSVIPLLLIHISKSYFECIRIQQNFIFFVYYEYYGIKLAETNILLYCLIYCIAITIALQCIDSAAIDSWTYESYDMMDLWTKIYDKWLSCILMTNTNWLHYLFLHVHNQHCTYLLSVTINDSVNFSRYVNTEFYKP